MWPALSSVVRSIRPVRKRRRNETFLKADQSLCRLARRERQTYARVLAVRSTQVQGRYLLRAFVWVNQLEAPAQRLTLKDCVDDAGDVASLP